MKEYGLICNLKQQKIAGLTVYPPSVLNGTSFFDDDILVDKDNAIAVHHYAGSWLDDVEKKTLGRLKRMYLKTKATEGKVIDMDKILFDL